MNKPYFRAFPDIEKPENKIGFSTLAAKSENKKAFQRQRRLGLAGCLVDMRCTCTIVLQSIYH